MKAWIPVLAILLSTSGASAATQQFDATADSMSFQVNPILSEPANGPFPGQCFGGPFLTLSPNPSALGPFTELLKNDVRLLGSGEWIVNLQARHDATQGLDNLVLTLNLRLVPTATPEIFDVKSTAKFGLTQTGGAFAGSLSSGGQRLEHLAELGTGTVLDQDPSATSNYGQVQVTLGPGGSAFFSSGPSFTAYRRANAVTEEAVLDLCFSPFFSFQANPAP